MNNVNEILTTEEKAFIKSQGLSISDFMDVRGLGGPKKYHDIVKAKGCHFVISNNCTYGHRLKSRSGRCIICDTRNIVFQKRDSIGGTIYVAVSGKYCKVGILDNKKNSLDALEHREYQMNSEGGYGGREDWTMIKSWDVQHDIGKVEREAHRLLQDYKVEGELYWYSNELRTADELFECTIQKATDAVKKALKSIK